MQADLAPVPQAIVQECTDQPGAAMAPQAERCAEAPPLLPPGEAVKPPAKRARRAASAERAGKGATVEPPNTTKNTEAVAMEEQSAEDSAGRASLYVVTKAVRNFLKGLPVPIHCGADFIPALNSMLQQQLNDAVTRAKANGRKTVRSSDI